jgi:hypothetical protein
MTSKGVVFAIAVYWVAVMAVFSAIWVLIAPLHQISLSSPEPYVGAGIMTLLLALYGLWSAR